MLNQQFDRALQTAGELKATEFHSSLGREYVREIQDVVDSMQGNLTPTHYELVLHKLDRVEQLRTLALQEEDNYVQTEVFVNSVSQNILGSQGYLSKCQLVLLSQAYKSLDQGNYTSAIEWAKQAKDLPLEPAPEKTDAGLNSLLWTTPPWYCSGWSQCSFLYARSGANSEDSPRLQKIMMMSKAEHMAIPWRHIRFFESWPKLGSTCDSNSTSHSGRR